MSELSRRDVLGTIGGIAVASGLGGLAASVALGADEKTDGGQPFKLPPLPYDYKALEPHIDEQTMRIHHGKHHAAYVDNLNKALQGHDDLRKLTIVQLLSRIDSVPESIRTAVNNNGGGHSNHSIFWELMAPAGSQGKAPSGALASAIDSTFGDLAKFQEKLSDAAMKRFGSGWAWLVADKEGKLSIESFANQDSPYSKGLKPILGVDVWEHAYYLKYQNRRADYLKAWWNIVNWEVVGMRYVKK